VCTWQLNSKNSQIVLYYWFTAPQHSGPHYTLSTYYFIFSFFFSYLCYYIVHSTTNLNIVNNLIVTPQQKEKSENEIWLVLVLCLKNNNHIRKGVISTSAKLLTKLPWCLEQSTTKLPLHFPIILLLRFQLFLINAFYVARSSCLGKISTCTSEFSEPK